MLTNLKRVILLSVLTLSVATSAFAGTVRLGWDYEGTGHRGFRLYYGRTSQASAMAPVAATGAAPYESAVDILDPGARQHELSLAEGTWYFRILTLGSSSESTFNDTEVTTYVGLKAPINLRIEGIMLMLTPTGGN